MPLLPRPRIRRPGLNWSFNEETKWSPRSAAPALVTARLVTARLTAVGCEVKLVCAENDHAAGLVAHRRILGAERSGSPVPEANRCANPQSQVASRL